MTTSLADLPSRAGDRVWAEQWAHHRGGVQRYVGALLGGDAHGVEDVVQETAIRFWQHRESLEGHRCVAGWLRTVARNIVVDRSRRRRARPSEIALTPSIDPVGDDVALGLVDAAESVAALLAGLAPPHRDVVLEVYVRDRSVAQVAIDLGIPEGTVKSRCHHALHRLRATTARPS